MATPTLNDDGGHVKTAQVKKAAYLSMDSTTVADVGGQPQEPSFGKRWNARGAPVNKTTRFAGIGGVVCADSSPGKVPTAVPGSVPAAKRFAATPPPPPSPHPSTPPPFP